VVYISAVRVYDAAVVLDFNVSIERDIFVQGEFTGEEARSESRTSTGISEILHEAAPRGYRNT
jgi:hypothetical protein